MKKYRLTDQKSILGALSKLKDKTLQSPTNNKHYSITNISGEKDILNSVNITIAPEEGEIGKPQILVCILKENKAELRIKQVNPYQDDLFSVSELIIEPLERSAERAAIKNINIWNTHVSPQVDLTMVLSLYGKTSIITQTINQFQLMLEHTLNQYGYFIKKVNIGFFYASDSPLIDSIGEAKSPFFIRDSYQKKFYTERSFYNPVGKLKDREIDAMLKSFLYGNIKSTLIVPFYGGENAIVGYVELQSNLPNLGNTILQEEIESPNGIGILISFLEAKLEEFTYELELAYVKEWKFISNKDDIIDISQDGRGIGLHFSSVQNSSLLVVGSKITFTIQINSINYEFFGSIRNIKKGKTPEDGLIVGIKIYTCNIPEGISLLSTYAAKLIGTTI
ncbi:MAG: hypothetical protein L6Q54_08090 [Leptospiraceae bacterium]|nr:hypothetical protein [Leptospiraceae bacterium]MCK6381194.1 hypothetical protein [Leptospiraceae bacterium]NUM40450.1 hypothetical protein [Leptospiraceae bacterium]